MIGNKASRSFQIYSKTISVLVMVLSFIVSAESLLAADYNHDYVGDQELYQVQEGETLLTIARDHGLGYVEIRSANPGIDPWLPETGRDITLPSRHLLPDAAREGVVINLSEMRLYAFLDADSPPITYPIGIGRDGLKTPLGKTRIIRKKDGPTWHPTQRMRDEDPSLPYSVGPGPDNPLGTHALYLGWPTFLIHGTSEPWGIGRRVSSGCIRLYPEDISRFFTQIPVNTSVQIVDQPIKIGWIDDQLYVEAHASQHHANKVESDGAQPPYNLSPDDMRLILTAAGDRISDIQWGKLRQAIIQRRGIPVAITQ